MFHRRFLNIILLITHTTCLSGVKLSAGVPARRMLRVTVIMLQLECKKSEQRHIRFRGISDAASL